MCIGQFRSIEEQDLPLLLQWRNSERIRKAMFGGETITWSEHVQWFLNAANHPEHVHLIYEHDGVAVGAVNFTRIDRSSGRCLWGFYLGVEGLPRGTGFQMGCQALEHAFQHLHMRKVSGEVLADNPVSIRFHQKLGFVQEGHFRQHILKNAVYHDVVFFSLLKEQWLSSLRNGLVNCPCKDGVDLTTRQHRSQLDRAEDVGHGGADLDANHQDCEQRN